MLQGMLKDDMPTNPIQELIDKKYAYLQIKKKDFVGWRKRHGQYPILLHLPFIHQAPNFAGTTSYRPRKRNKRIGNPSNIGNNETENTSQFDYGTV